jgi:hypothetical protein
MADCLSENTQRTLLQNAVIGLNALRQVQINSNLQQATHGTALTFAEYHTLLINSATSYNKRNDKPNSNGKPRRSVFNLESLLGDHDETLKFDYGVDTIADKLQAYALNRRECPQFKSRSRMPIARWKALSEQAKQIWDTTSDDGKTLILALQEKIKEAPQSDQSKFSVNTYTATLTPDTPSDNIDDVLLAMVTKNSNWSTQPSSHPGDIRLVLSQPTKTAKAQVQYHKISVNGDTYVRQVQSHYIRYSVSQASRKKISSLTDRGANRGIAGIDTEVIECHTHQTVNIRGIDNHEITSIHIVTDRAVARSQWGCHSYNALVRISSAARKVNSSVMSIGIFCQ